MATAADEPDPAEAAKAAPGGADAVPQAVPLPEDAGLLDQVFARHLENRLEIIKEVQAELSGGKDGGLDLVEVPASLLAASRWVSAI